MKTCAVILLYNRILLMEELSKRLKKCGVDGIIVIRNDIANQGTAKGYSDGIRRAMVEDYDYIWLMDDDNFPHTKALENLREGWQEHGLRNDRDAIVSYREGYNRLVDINSVIGTPNAVLGLNLFRYRETRNNVKRHIDWIGTRELPCCMYGGMLFHKDLIDRIGLPDKDLFLYCDDYEWSRRIVDKGGTIVLSNMSLVMEMDHKRDSDTVVYYQTRNHLLFQKKFVTNKLIFFINYLAYCFHLYTKKQHNKLKALRDGYKKKNSTV